MKEKYKNFSFYEINEYAKNIYSIRPPYKMAHKYNPKKMAPYKILKNIFLNNPIEGYRDKINLRISEDEKNIGKIVKYFDKKEIPIINKIREKKGIIMNKKTRYQEEVEKDFKNDKIKKI
jgi:hypothetical protein